MNNYRINNHYAKALMLLSNDLGVLDAVSEDMRLVSQVCAENHQLSVLFANPMLPVDRKKAIIEDLFGAHVSKPTMAFLLFVTRKNRSVNLRGIADTFIDMYREERGIVYSDFVTHQPIDDEARRMVTQMVGDYTGKQVELHDRTDSHMLGGFKLEFDGKMYDARIRSKIRRMRIEFGRNVYESKL